MLLKESPWINLSKYYDTTIFIKVSLDTLRQRLEKRWEALSEENKKRKILDNDLPNANYVFENSKESEFVYENEDENVS